MKKILLFSLLSLALIIPFSASAEQTKGVVTTIKPLHSLVAGIMGETGAPELLVAGNVSPHEFQLKPSQMKVLQEANVVFYIDDSYETFLHDAFETLPAHVRKAAVAQKGGLTVLAHRKGGAWEAHEYKAHEHEAEETHEHEEHAHHEEHHHDHGHDDMHVWLDPVNAEKIVKFITKELSAVYPENKVIYKANASLLVERLNALDAKLKQDLAGFGDKPFIVFHDAYQYFETRFGLRAAGSITLNPDVQPGARRIKELRARLQAGGAVCVFAEPQFEPKLVATLIDGTNVRKGTLDPIGVALTPGPGAYEGLLRGLATDLRTCLGATS